MCSRRIGLARWFIGFREPARGGRSRGFGVNLAKTSWLRPEQEAWLQARVTSGEFGSLEAAVQQLLGEEIAQLDFEPDDLAWAKPYVDEGLAAYERGEYMTLEEHQARNAAPLSALGK